MSQPTRELLEGLNELAQVAKQMAAGAVDRNHDGQIDWKDLVSAAGDERFTDVVQRVLANTQRAELLQALHVLDAKKVALRRGRSFEQLSDDELDQYEALRSTEAVLHQAADKIERDRHELLAWLVDDGLPILARTIALVLPLVS